LNLTVVATIAAARPSRTRSGKILRGTIKKIADGDAWTMPATIDDPAILDEIGSALKTHGVGVARAARPVLSTSWPGLSRPSTSYLNIYMAGGWVYFITNKRDGVLYAGVTSDLPRRVYEHQEGQVAGFSRRYGLKMLVYYEHFDDIRDAIQREKTIKHWPRAWKVRLLHAMNPTWDDLYDTLI
jgi:putative endonuclease